MDCPNRDAAQLDMFSEFERLRSDFVEFGQHENADLEIDETIHFPTTVNAFKGILSMKNAATK